MVGLVPGDIPDCIPPRDDIRAPTITMPAKACDCHAHVCGPADIFPLNPARLYSPIRSTLAEYQTMLGILGIERAVLVQPSFYGTDNRALLSALQANPTTMRGIAAIGEETSRTDLKALHAAGIRGIRFNIVDQRANKGVLPVESIGTLAGLIADLGWHIELLMHVDDFPDIERLVADLPVDIVLAHFGYPHGPGSADSPGCRAFLRLLERHRAWVKLTGPYRVSRKEIPYADLLSPIRTIVVHAPERLLWGSDWPHVRASWPTAMPDDGDLADLLNDWIPDTPTRHRVLVENPAQLYWSA